MSTLTRHRLGDREYACHVESWNLEIDDRVVADAWTFGYVTEPIDRARPVLFLFNGGPGVASMWLHLSGLGPFKADTPVDLDAPASATSPLVPSAHTLLDEVDLVFVDPANTGFSRLADGAEPSEATGVDRDAALTAQVIRRWLRRHGRFASPVALLGESYGTVRAPLTATALRQDGIIVTRIALLGQCLNTQEVNQRAGNAAGYVAALPFLAATAWFHGRSAHADLTLDEVTRTAHAFAVRDYALALGEAEPAGAVVDTLAGFTGLTPAQLRCRRLRVDKEEFRRILLADAGRTVGLTDTRYTIAAGDEREPYLDAADVRLAPVFTAALHELFTGPLGLSVERDYRPAVSSHRYWNYLEASALHRFDASPTPSPFAVFDYPAHLSALFRADPRTRVFIGTGHFDALTTVGAVEHLKAQYGLPADRISEGRYPAGHMMYSDPASLAALSADLRAFLRD
ncbi:hypothetical protein NQ166_00970 [Microbacterium sp. zg.Y1090]|uniref:S10 family serine carboxypeptidase-like protein n=1 Tax=Microbacterium wangruii TaxID=3049073 RepID=UPI00214CA6C7|nr:MULTISPECIES: hypothetical protein [unclassified Microbacterium]MCR2817399.1 hypothetical protein [Microbacterium sp. zg.Y1090]WIM29115.1 hypothetical protein QNO26_04240 [Microbacterium sp. zg-Y1090]